MSGMSNVALARQIWLFKDVQELGGTQHQRPSTVAIGNPMEVLELLLVKLHAA